MAKRGPLPTTGSYRPDDNALSYVPDLDGRNATGDRLQYVPLGLIHPSPHQTRLVRDLEADRLLAEDVEERGLVHAPVVRAHPAITGAFEIVAGHRRTDAARLLAREGRGGKVLRGASTRPDHRCLGVFVRQLDDLAASGQTIAENLVRDGLRPWEQARALLRHQAMLVAAGEPSSRRAVAASLDHHRATVAPYLQVAERLTPEVLAMAADSALFPTHDPVAADDAALCRLSLEALQRAARGETPRARAEALRREISRALVRPQSRSRGQGAPASPPGPDGGFQLNIRRPLGSLSRRQAERYLERLAAASLVLLDQANPGQPVVHKSAHGARLILVPELGRLGDAETAALAASLKEILADLGRRP